MNPGAIKYTNRPMRADAVDRSPSMNLVLLCAAAWAIPGAGHLWLGRLQKAALFFAAFAVFYLLQAVSGD